MRGECFSAAGAAKGVTLGPLNRCNRFPRAVQERVTSSEDQRAEWVQPGATPRGCDDVRQWWRASIFCRHCRWLAAMSTLLPSSYSRHERLRMRAVTMASGLGARRRVALGAQ